MSCEIDEKYLAQETYKKDGEDEEPATDDRWAALDDLDSL